MTTLTGHLAACDRGQTSVEYAAVLLVVAIVLVFALAAGVDGLLDIVPSEFMSSIP